MVAWVLSVADPAVAVSAAANFPQSLGCGRVSCNIVERLRRDVLDACPEFSITGHPDIDISTQVLICGW